VALVPPAYRWKLWYADGSMFSSEDGEPWASPVQRVVCVTQPGVVGKDLLYNETHYLHHRDGEWSAHDLLGFVDQTTYQIHTLDCHRMGWDMPTEPFKRIVNWALREVRGA
jgi:hypothetical protein